MTSACEKCEFPAIASANEIARGRVAVNIEAPLTTRERWARSLIVIGYSLLLLGAFIVRVVFGTSMTGTFIGILIASVGALLIHALSRFEGA